MKKTLIFFYIYIIFFANFYLICLSLETFDSNAYEPVFFNFSDLMHQPVGVFIACYNRPQYLKLVVDSIERNQEAQTYPFFFFLDGGPGATQLENEEIINKSLIKNKFIIKRNRNYGCSKNLIDARRFMFDWCNFDKVIVLEDDMLISPYYFTFIINLFNWAKNNFYNVGIVQCWSYCFLNAKDKVKKLNYVKADGNEYWSFVSYCLDKRIWNQMKRILYQYERFIDLIPDTNDYFLQRSKPNLWVNAYLIKEWARQLIDKKEKIYYPNDKVFNNNLSFDYIDYVKSEHFCVNQDAITAFALWMADSIKIQSVVNRAIHIGEHGITSNSDIYKTCGYSKIILNTYNEDAIIHNFIVDY